MSTFLKRFREIHGMREAPKKIKTRDQFRDWKEDQRIEREKRERNVRRLGKIATEKE